MGMRDRRPGSVGNFFEAASAARNPIVLGVLWWPHSEQESKWWNRRGTQREKQGDYVRRKLLLIWYRAESCEVSMAQVVWRQNPSLEKTIVATWYFALLQYTVQNYDGEVGDILWTIGIFRFIAPASYPNFNLVESISTNWTFCPLPFYLNSELFVFAHFAFYFITLVSDISIYPFFPQFSQFMHYLINHEANFSSASLEFLTCV